MLIVVFGQLQRLVDPKYWSMRFRKNTGVLYEMYFEDDVKSQEVGFAQKYCQLYSGSLASLYSSNEKTALEKLLKVSKCRGKQLRQILLNLIFSLLNRRKWQ